MRTRKHMDVPTLVTGLALTGFGLLSAGIALGAELASPTSIWFAIALLIAGFVGLFVSLARRPGSRNN